MAMTMEEIRKRITYHREGDVLIPDIRLSEPEDAPPLRRYGMMRKDYLKEHYLIEYELMTMEETLFAHLRETDEAAENLLRTLLPELAAQAGATENLKREGRKAWKRRMQECRAEAEEIIQEKLIFRKPKKRLNYSGFQKEAETMPMGKYGMMRRTFLRESSWNLYTDLLYSGKLFPHLWEIQETAAARMEHLMDDLLKANPAPDKKTHQMEWVGHMNMLKAQAEEVVMAELINS